METIAVLLPTAVPLAEIGAYLAPFGAQPGDGRWTVERGAAGVYLSMVNPGEAEVQEKRAQFPWQPEAVLLISIGHRSENLAFETATAVAGRWKGAIDWGGLHWLERLFDEWSSTRP